ncbi:hypothetical protein FF011L_10900 [Roseimaritima multifibrata]|uniref:Uncharacterized protein n=1 Tax=Roseimaritima multifibrata TaxID=1930274 RepID=A0A517MBT1_9BACT|nr:hypothetical protein FF011L_10900 [Roseimaritima multifibrata]
MAGDEICAANGAVAMEKQMGSVCVDPNKYPSGGARAMSSRTVLGLGKLLWGKGAKFVFASKEGSIHLLRRASNSVFGKNFFRSSVSCCWA